MGRLLCITLILGLVASTSLAKDKPAEGTKNAEKIIGVWKLLKVSDKKNTPNMHLEFLKDKTCKMTIKLADGNEKTLKGAYEFLEETKVKITMEEAPKGEESVEMTIDKLTDDALVLIDSKEKDKAEFERVKEEKKKEEKKDDKK